MQSQSKITASYFCGYKQTDAKVYMEKQKTQKSHDNFEEEQSWRTYTTQLKTYYKDTVIKTM